MPATNSSRSVGPEPDTSTTAGRRTGTGFRPVAGGASAETGLEIVAARLKPFAGIVTSSSFGRAMVTRRADTPAMSSRSTVSICVGMSTRSRRLPSVHTSISSFAEPAAQVQRPSSRRNDAPRYLDGLVRHVVNERGQGVLGRDEHLQLRADFLRRQPRGERFVCAEDQVRQHDGVAGHGAACGAEPALPA